VSAQTPRRPAYAGAIGLVITLLLVLAALNAGRLPFIGQGGHVLAADFTDASGIEKGDRVEVAGIRVGAVRSLAMGRGYIKVSFTIDQHIHLGSTTTARIKVGNLLGSKYLQVMPAGTGSLSGTIPVSRTAPAYDVTQALGDFTNTVAPINTGQLETALNSITTTFRGAGPDVRASVRGLSSIARTIADRDQDVSSLLNRSQRLTATLDGSRGDIAALVTDAGNLLAELNRRRAAIHGLIVHTDALAAQLHGLVVDNRATITPALVALGKVTGQLESRQASVEATLTAVAKFSRLFVDTIGSGPWFDSYLGNAPDSLKIEGP
jgi:phospholipid/cholesterol/gamma-HCH transport system substrate-binding protein